MQWNEIKLNSKSMKLNWFVGLKIYQYIDKKKAISLELWSVPNGLHEIEASIDLVVQLE